MSQRDSDYVREKDDLYQTPAWVTRLAVPHLPVRDGLTWECADGKGLMSSVLREAYGASRVVCSDINPSPSPNSFELNFLQASLHRGVQKIVTNPPYSHATEFIEHALCLTEEVEGVVAMLLKADFDHAMTRSHLFGHCPAFYKEIVLTRRIKWFDRPVPCKPCSGTGRALGLGSTGIKCPSCRGQGEKKSSPSENHSWFIWDWRHSGPATKAYGP